MRRREFLLASVGAGGAAAVASSTAGARRPTADVMAGRLAQEDEPDEDVPDEDANDDDEAADDAPAVEEIEVGDNFFDPDNLQIESGTTVRWIWVGDIMHNVNPTSQPDDADWGGHPELVDSGEYEFTFEVLGTYEYTCDPHPGMDGTIEVVEEVTDEAPVPPAQQELDPDEIGVPLQKHFIGIATFFAIFLTLVFTFYVLKYGETPHSGSPNRRR